MGEDSYITIASPSEGLFKDKGSRFISAAFPVSSTDEIKEIIDKIRKRHHEARHHCYAYVLGHDRLTWRANDAGEPSGTAGKPILGQINSSGLTNILIVVSRYFGGTLLGTSGLINAYRSAAQDAIKNSRIVECTLNDYFKLRFPYNSLNDVMKILKEESAGQTEKLIDTECSMTVFFISSHRNRILEKLARVSHLRHEYMGTS